MVSCMMVDERGRQEESEGGPEEGGLYRRLLVRGCKMGEYIWRCALRMTRHGRLNSLPSDWRLASIRSDGQRVMANRDDAHQARRQVVEA